MTQHPKEMAQPVDQPAVAKGLTEWIAVDWGTTNLRAFAMAADGCVLAAAASHDGMEKLGPADFEPALLRLIRGWLPDMGAPMPVVLCGMAGARGGWIEAPYRRVPCAPIAQGETIAAPTLDPRIRVEIVPGLRQDAPPDVMRGEETQIAGFLAAEPGFDGLLILPGTHSKHVRVSSGRVLSFKTWMTGEIFAVIADHTVLRRTMTAGAPTLEAAQSAEFDTEFEAGLTIGRSGGALGALFGLRAGALLNGVTPTAARARLSGLLLGAELADLAQTSNVVVIGSDSLARRYARALTATGAVARIADGADLARKGLAMARRRK